MSPPDQLARLAADAEPPPLDDAAAGRMIERAVLAACASAPRERSPAPRWPYALATAAVAAAAAMWLVRPQPQPPEPLRVELPTGDHLTGTSGARFEVAQVEPAHRKVILRRGTLLADVAHVVAGQRFEIATAHLVATARGTVFSVETDARHTRVLVYEGSVDVLQGDVHHVVPTGGTWSSDAPLLAAGSAPPAGLADAVDEALAARRAAPPATPAPIAVAAVPPAEPPAVAAPVPPRRERAVVAAPVPPPPDVTEVPLATLYERAQSELAAGRLDRALAIAKLAEARGASGAWRLVTADALRGLGKADEAADAYEAAARELSAPDAYEAGYTAAYLRFKEVRDYERALAALVAAKVDTEGSPLEERGLALHVDLLVALGRAAETRELAARYLQRYPHGDRRVDMVRLAPQRYACP